MLDFRHLLKFRIQNIPFIVGFLLLLILVRRAQQNWDILAEFVEERKKYDLIGVRNGISFIDKPPVTNKDQIKKAVKEMLNGAHRNTLFILGESRDAPEIIVQPINKLSGEEIQKAQEIWGDGSKYYKIYSKAGFTFNFKQKTYHAIASTVKINNIDFDLLAFSNVSNTIEKAYKHSLTELTVLLIVIAFLILVILTTASRAVTQHANTILIRKKSEIKYWWPEEIKIAATNYNEFLASEAQYKVQIDQSTSGQMIVRSRGEEEAIIHSPNKAIATISGYTQSELEGYPLNQIVPEAYHDFHRGIGIYDEELQRKVGMAAYAERCPFHGTKESRVVGRDRTVDLKHKNGSIRKVLLGVYYLGKNDKHVDEWAVVITDVTDLVAAIAKAEAFAKDTENITHIFAHDLKAGEIASSKAGEYITETSKDLIEYLRQAGALDKPIERSLSFIAKYSARITASCQNNFALIDQRNKLHDLKERITPEPHKIADIFKGVEVSFTRADGKLLFIDECPHETTANIDIALFLAALKNLVKNGLAYNDSIEKVIEVKAIKENDKIVFSITDNGIGFPPEYLLSWGQIQGQAARLDLKREGSGTGLYSVRRIIEAHSGATVEVKSEQGVGSTFVITLGA